MSIVGKLHTFSDLGLTRSPSNLEWLCCRIYILIIVLRKGGYVCFSDDHLHSSRGRRNPTMALFSLHICFFLNANKCRVTLGTEGFACEILFFIVSMRRRFIRHQHARKPKG